MKRAFLVGGVLVLSVITSVVAFMQADKPGPKVGQTAKEFELSALGGGKVKLSEVNKQKVVLVVLRGYPGYQCPLCSRQFAEFLKLGDEFKNADTQVVFIYPGPAEKLQERAADFAKGRDYPKHFSILLDGDYKFTNSYGLRWDARNETAYPSTFVIETDGKISFAKVSTTHGDRVPAAEALKVAKKK
jgi:thioredoxin-dependent peroxiredoxin